MRDQGTVQMGAGFVVNMNDRCAPFGKSFEVTLRLRNHQMHIQWLLAIGANRFQQRKTKRDIRHEHAIHHIEMKVISFAAVY